MSFNDEDVKKFDERMARDLARPGSTRTLRSGTKEYKFRRRAGGYIYVVITSVLLPLRPEVEEFARRVQGQDAREVPGVADVERRVVEALRQGARTYRIRSGTTMYTFGRWSRDGRHRGGLQVAVGAAHLPVNPALEAYARQLQKIALCRRPDCRAPFQRTGRQKYCSPACASTIRSRRARQ